MTAVELNTLRQIFGHTFMLNFSLGNSLAQTTMTQGLTAS